ncbi:MAG: hypothetical protein PHH26_05530, partial [Candidatus Thermoplasmatota archaeon]|nr:hypothetical protein [Candidatus Thermoplasmatota archaeon]
MAVQHLKQHEFFSRTYGPSVMFTRNWTSTIPQVGDDVHVGRGLATLAFGRHVTADRPEWKFRLKDGRLAPVLEPQLSVECLLNQTKFPPLGVVSEDASGNILSAVKPKLQPPHIAGIDYPAGFIEEQSFDSRICGAWSGIVMLRDFTGFASDGSPLTNPISTDPMVGGTHALLTPAIESYAVGPGGEGWLSLAVLTPLPDGERLLSHCVVNLMGRSVTVASSIVLPNAPGVFPKPYMYEYVVVGMSATHIFVVRRTASSGGYV